MKVGLAIGLIMLTKTTHPHAGADPLIIILGSYMGISIYICYNRIHCYSAGSIIN